MNSFKEVYGEFSYNYEVNKILAKKTTAKEKYEELPYKTIIYSEIDTANLFIEKDKADMVKDGVDYIRFKLIAIKGERFTLAAYDDHTPCIILKMLNCSEYLIEGNIMKRRQR